MPISPAAETIRRNVLGWSLACPLIDRNTNGSMADVTRDVVFTADGSDLDTVSGDLNVAQALEIALTTALGSDVFNTRFGFDGLRALAEPDSLLAREQVRVGILQTLQQDPRVRTIVDLKLLDRRLDPAAATVPGVLAVEVVYETIAGERAVVRLGPGGTNG